MHMRRAPIKDICYIPLKEVEHCLKERDSRDTSDSEDEKAESTTTSCETKLSQASKCEKIATKAYEKINMGGCTREIKMATLCRDEWCSNLASSGEDSACSKECTAVNDSLLWCERKFLDTFFRRASLNSDGTAQKE